MAVTLHCVLSSALINVSAFAQSSTPGARIATKLERAGVIDNYFPEIVFEVASAPVAAAPNQWRGVQVNQVHRAG